LAGNILFDLFLYVHIKYKITGWLLWRCYTLAANVRARRCGDIPCYI